MGRVYTVQFTNQTLSEARDLFELTPADDIPIKLLGLIVTIYDSETNTQITGTIKRFSGAYTSGSGGSTATPVRISTKDAAASFTCETYNSTRATGGTEERLHVEGFASQGGWAYFPIPGCEPIAVQGCALVPGLEFTAGGVGVNAVAYVEELN
jgi:hypothetical protein